MVAAGKCVAALRRLDATAIERVCNEAWPEPRTADELHDALVVLGFITEAEGLRGNRADGHADLEFGWQHLYEQLEKDGRTTILDTGAARV